MPTQALAKGRHVLVVEDEMSIVLEIETVLMAIGAQVVGPTAHLNAALRLAKEATIDVAVLDINIRGGTSYPVADILAGRAVPFVFCSGYGVWALEPTYRDRPHLAKPFTAPDLERQVLNLLASLPP